MYTNNKVKLFLYLLSGKRKITFATLSPVLESDRNDYVFFYQKQNRKGRENINHIFFLFNFTLFKGRTYRNKIK